MDNESKTNTPQQDKQITVAVPEDRVPELLTLRQIQLGLESSNPESADKKLALRLEGVFPLKYRTENG